MGIGLCVLEPPEAGDGGNEFDLPCVVFLYSISPTLQVLEFTKADDSRYRMNRILFPNAA